MKRILFLKVFMFVVFLSLGAVSMVEAQGIPDFGGETITITTWGARPQRYLDTYAPGRLEEAERLFNAKIEILVFPKNELAGVNMNRLLSGDSRLDLWNMEHDQFWPLVIQGALLGTSGVLPADYYTNLHPVHQKMALAWNFLGEDYYVGSAPAAYSAAMFLIYNQDIIDREGLEDPYELWLEGNWNWDTFEQLMREATRDTTGDGLIDQRGFNHEVHYQNWIPTNGANVVKESQGRLLFALHEEPAVYGMNKLHQWRTEGLMVPGTEEQNALFALRQGWSIENRATNWDGHTYAFIPYPQGPHADPTVHLAPFWAELGYSLPANSERPEDLVAVLDFLYPAPEFQEHLERMVRSMVLDRTSYQMAMWHYENAEVVVNTWKNFIGSNEYDLAAVEATTEGGAASKMAAIAQATQVLLDDIFAKGSR